MLLPYFQWLCLVLYIHFMHVMCAMAAMFTNERSIAENAANLANLNNITNDNAGGNGNGNYTVNMPPEKHAADNGGFEAMDVPPSYVEATTIANGTNGPATLSI